MRPKRYLMLSAVALVIALGAGAFAFAELRTNSQLSSRIDAIEQTASASLGTFASSSAEGAAAPATRSSSALQKSAAVRTVSSEEDLTAAVAKVSPAVVSIQVYKNVPQYTIEYDEPFPGSGIRVPHYVQSGESEEKVAAGTGFFIREDGYIVTNNHVVDDSDASYTVLLPNSKEVSASVVAGDAATDVALIKIAGSGYPVASFGSSRTLKLGQSVFAIGNALGQYGNTVSVGIVSGENRTIDALASDGSAEHLTGVIQTDAAINPGNSGGPLSDLSGEVVGMSVAIASGAQNIGFAIPSETVQAFISQNL